MIYVLDHPPPHVHVVGAGDAKIALDESVARVVHNRGLSKADLKRALNVVQDECAKL